MSRKTTLQQLAEAAGVSLSTVDRVLNRRGGVSSAREARVMECAARLNLDRVLYRDHLKMLRIAVLMQSPKNPFYAGMRNAFDELNNSMWELKINCFIHHIDMADLQAVQGKIGHIGATYDGLIVICPDTPDLNDALRSISGRIPIVTLVSDLPDCGRIAYVGPDNRQAGRVMGELMGRFLGPEGGELLVILGMQQIRGHEEREMGFRSVLRERFANCRIVSSLETGEQPQRAATGVQKALQHNPQIRGIYNVSSGTDSIARILQTMDLEQRILLLTHELTPEHHTLLRSGVIDTILDQNPLLEARRALETLARHFNRLDGEIQLHEHVPFSLYFQENCPPVEF